MLDIRLYRSDDSAALISLLKELQAFEAALYDRMKPAADMGAWYIELLEKRCREEAGKILMAWDGGSAVGYATIFTNVAEDGSGDELPYVYACVGDLVVTRDARRQGVGRQLLEGCEFHARAVGRDELRIGLLAMNEVAHRLYRAAGFADHQISMRKRLGA